MDVIRGEAKIETKKFLERMNPGITIPALTEHFDAWTSFHIHFRSGTKKEFEKGKAKIYVEENFRDCFFQQVVRVRGEQTLSSYRLKEFTGDKVIRSELGPNHEIDLAAVFHLINQQPNGEDGILLTKGFNVFFVINDITKVVQEVTAHWGDPIFDQNKDSWYVGAGDLGESHKHGLIFARNPDNN
ncbi:MAG: hypothetical protein WAV11_01095 [Minisyncoccia bacterium]